MLYLIIITNTISSKTNRQCQFCLLKFDVILLKQILIDVLMTGLAGFTLTTFHFRIINLNTPDDDTSFSFFSLSLFLSFYLYLIFFLSFVQYVRVSLYLSPLCVSLVLFLSFFLFFSFIHSFIHALY